jgi:hypothetical protein
MNILTEILITLVISIFDYVSMFLSSLSATAAPPVRSEVFSIRIFTVAPSVFYLTFV